MIDTHCICYISCARYGFNMPNYYLKTKPNYEHDKKYFSDLVEYFKNLGIVSEYFQACQ